jgi:hypothetical protein
MKTKYEAKLKDAEDKIQAFMSERDANATLIDAARLEERNLCNSQWQERYSQLEQRSNIQQAQIAELHNKLSMADEADKEDETPLAHTVTVAAPTTVEGTLKRPLASNDNTEEMADVRSTASDTVLEQAVPATAREVKRARTETPTVAPNAEMVDMSAAPVDVSTSEPPSTEMPTPSAEAAVTPVLTAQEVSTEEVEEGMLPTAEDADIAEASDQVEEEGEEEFLPEGKSILLDI